MKETTLLRIIDLEKIYSAYAASERSLREVGRLLRVSTENRYIWSNKHKTAVSGMIALIRTMMDDVPKYRCGSREWRGVTDDDSQLGGQNKITSSAP